MATRLSMFRPIFQRGSDALLKRNAQRQVIAKRTMTSTETGAMLPQPFLTKFGFVKVIVVSFPFLYLGQWMGKTTAAWLEDWELFVPDDDDD